MAADQGRWYQFKVHSDWLKETDAGGQLQEDHRLKGGLLQVWLKNIHQL